MDCNLTTCAPTTAYDLCKNSSLFRKTAESIAVALCYAVLVPLTVIGNGLVIAACITNTRLRTATNVFICGLAVSDLLVGLFSIPFWTHVSLHVSLAVAYCMPAYQLYISVDIFAGCASILQLTAIALERFVFTVFPLRHRRMSRRVYWAMLILAWAVATIMGALHPIQYKNWHEVYSVVLFLCCFLFPLAIIASIYSYIFKIGRYHARKRKSSTTNVGSSGGFVKEFNLAVTVLVITGVFVVAWLPFFVVTIIATFCLQCLPPMPGLSYLVKFVKLMQYAGSAINPYIYAYRNAEMRRSFYKLLRKFFICERSREIVVKSPGRASGAKCVHRSGSIKRDSVFRSASFRRKRNSVADSNMASEKRIPNCKENQAGTSCAESTGVYNRVSYV